MVINLFATTPPPSPTANRYSCLVSNGTFYKDLLHVSSCSGSFRTFVLRSPSSKNTHAHTHTHIGVTSIICKTVVNEWDLGNSKVTHNTSNFADRVCVVSFVGENCTCSNLLNGAIKRLQHAGWEYRGIRQTTRTAQINTAPRLQPSA